MDKTDGADAKMTLSRLDSEGFVKNVHYAAAYWDEHARNFREMVMRLLEDATVLKIAANASGLSLGYNHQKGTVPPQYNQKVIFPAYEVLEQQLNKTLLCDALDAYMQIISSMGEETIPLEKLFSTPEALQKMNFFCETCLGAGYDKEACGKYFLPQLLLYFLRFLDIYDNSLKGALMDNYLEELKRMQMESRMKDDKGVKQLWEKMKQQKEEQEKATKTAPAASGGKKAAAAKSTTAPVVNKGQAQQAAEKAKAEGEGVEITDVDEDDEEKQREEHVNRLLGNINIFADMQRDKHEREEMLEKRMGAKNEIHFLEKSATKGRELLGAFWDNRSAEFLQKWEALSLEEKRKVLGDTRNFLLTMGSGSYSTAVLYCPELNVDDLTATADAQAPSGAAPAAQGGLTFTSLLKRCLADPATQADSFAEQFLAPLVKQKLLDTQFESERERKEQEQEVMSMAAMITVSRRFILLTFACKVLSEVLGVPFDELAPATSLLQPLKAVESENVRGMLFKETPNLRTCSNPKCDNRETKEKTFLVCSLCRKAGLSTPYCSRGCQAGDWPEHKKTCGVATAPAGRPASSGAKIEELVETKREQQQQQKASSPSSSSSSSAPPARTQQQQQPDAAGGPDQVWERIPDSSLAGID